MIDQIRLDLDTEMRIARNHIRNMQEIAALSFENSTPEETIKKGMAIVLKCVELKHGSLTLKYSGQTFSHHLNISSKIVNDFYHDQSSTVDIDRSFESNSPTIGRAKIKIINRKGIGPNCCPNIKTIIMAEIIGVNNIEVTCLLVDEKKRDYKQFHHRLQSLLHQIVTSVGNQLLVQEKSRRHKQGKELLQRVLKGQEEERRRVSRELHDTLAQDLAAHRLHIERLNSDKYLNDKSEMNRSLNELESNAKRMLLNLREIMFDLRPTILEEMGFLPAIQWYLERLEEKNSIDGILKIRGSEQSTSYLVQITLFRIFQEALQNIIGHAEASMVNVIVEYSSENFISMKIEDDGKGFKLVELENGLKGLNERGLGILGMKERSELINGTFNISSIMKQGTTISIKCPLKLK